MFAAVLFLLPAMSGAASNDASESLRSFLEGLDAGDAPAIAGRTFNEPELLARVYRSRNSQPIWLDGAPLNKETANLLTAIGESVAHGFAAERYHRSTIERLMKARDGSSRLALELLLTDAFLSQALHRGRGAVFPPNLDADWQLPQAEIDAAAFLLDAAKTKRNVAKALANLWPTSPEYARLVQRRAEIAATGDEFTVQIASGKLLKPGQSDDRIVLLKQRLMGPGDYSRLYDEDLRREVVAYQRAAGLEADGIVGDNTLEVLNATRVSWLDRIDANLERWRWLPRETPGIYLRVNIAAFTLRAIEDGKTTLAMNVIVGRPYRQTPVFTETIKYIVFNPFWNVPYSIATQDKLPLLKANAAAEAGKGFEAKPAGSDTFVPVDSINWSGVTRRNFNYLLRQRPGPANALGQMKFMLPNPHAVYLHDTPSRELFGKQERTFSSGCVRLERPRDLATWLLSRDRNPQSERLDALLKSPDTTTVYLKTPVPVYIVYFTAFVADDGDVALRRDVYGRDAVVIEALRAQAQ
ncbi:MAG: L,D-transpeptidase family protein [Woeseiaceae bacterium]|nr:L,D-transpeptidase family protein [Woeseiaceae bacterium]